jgi:hypothetical protein
MRPVLCLIVFAATVPLFAQEMAVSPPLPVPMSLPFAIAAASDGADFLAVWSDIAVTTRRLRCARVFRNGVVADAPKLLVRKAPPEVILTVAAAFSADRYLIVWSGATSAQSEAVLLDRDANVLRSLPSFGDRFPMLASLNGRFVAASPASALVISPDGDVVTKFALPFRTAAICASAGELAIVSPGEIAECTAAGCRIRHALARVALDGHVIAQSAIETFAAGDKPRLDAYSMASGSDGGLFITYAEYNGDQSSDVRRLGTILTDHDLGPLDAPMSFSSDFLPYDARTTTQWDGDHYLVAVNGLEKLMAVRVGRDPAPVTFENTTTSLPRGLVIPTPGGYFLFLIREDDRVALTSVRRELTTPTEEATIPIVPDQPHPSIATDGRSILAAWNPPSNYPGNVVLLTASGARTVAENLYLPQVMFDGAGYLFFLGAHEGIGSPGIFSAQLVDSGGTVQGPIPLPESHYAISNGTLFFLFAQSPVKRRLLFRRVSRAGVKLDPIGLVVAEAPQGEMFADSLATNGGDVYVIARHWPDNVATLARVSPDDTVLQGGSLPLTDGRAAVAGNTLFVTGTSGDGDAKELVIGAWTPELQLRWPNLIRLGGADAAALFAIAADGDTAVVVWRESRRLAGARISRDGAVTPFSFGDVIEPIARLCLAVKGETIAVAYIRSVPEEPHRGAERMFVRRLPPPPRRRASAP